MRKLTIATALALITAFGTYDAYGQEAGAAKVRKDPKGQTGISPYMEELAKGRQAFLGGDHDAAVGAFDAAIAADGQRMSAYLLKAQSLMAKGDIDAALKAAKEAGTKGGSQAEQSKLLFLKSDLKERKADVKPGPAPAAGGSGLQEALATSWEKVKEAWSAYAVFLTAHTELPDFTATADERKKKVDARVKRDAVYGKVAALIKKNAEEREKKAAKGDK